MSTLENVLLEKSKFWAIHLLVVREKVAWSSHLRGFRIRNGSRALPQIVMVWLLMKKSKSRTQIQTLLTVQTNSKMTKIKTNQKILKTFWDHRWCFDSKPTTLLNKGTTQSYWAVIILRLLAQLLVLRKCIQMLNCSGWMLILMLIHQKLLQAKTFMECRWLTSQAWFLITLSGSVSTCKRIFVTLESDPLSLKRSSSSKTRTSLSLKLQNVVKKI